MTATTWVIQHVADEHAGLVLGGLHARGIVPKVVRVYAGEPVPTALGDAAALVIMGGPMGVYEAARYEHLKDELRLIERALAAEAPVLGICLGSQLIAHALGATVRKGSAREIGWLPVTLSEAAAEDMLFAGGGSSLVPLHWHGDIFDLPAGAELLARSELTAAQAFRYGARVYGFLFHAEVTEDIVHGMARSFANELAEEGLTASSVVDQAPARIAALEPIATRMFDRWASLVEQAASSRRPGG